MFCFKLFLLLAAVVVAVIVGRVGRHMAFLEHKYNFITKKKEKLKTVLLPSWSCSLNVVAVAAAAVVVVAYIIFLLVYMCLRVCL